jgi:hypothetical protein
MQAFGGLRCRVKLNVDNLLQHTTLYSFICKKKTDKQTITFVMARGKGNKYAKEKRGSYKRDHSYVDYSENEDYGLYEDGI